MKKQALGTPLLDITDISTAYGVLIHILGGEDMTLDEVAIAGEQIMDKVPNTKRVIWGAKVDQNLTGAVRVMAVLTGVTCPFIVEVATKKETASIPKEVVKPLREAKEQMAQAQEIPKSTGEKQSRMEIIKRPQCSARKGRRSFLLFFYFQFLIIE